VSIIVSGNPNFGLGAALKKAFPETEFWSRTSGEHDLTNPDQQARFADRSLSFDTYISCSCLHSFHQVILVEKVYSAWIHAGHHGHIIALGSTSDTPMKGTRMLYPTEKKSLKLYCRGLSMASLGGHGSKPSGVKVTYLSVGYLDTGTQRKVGSVRELSCSYVASVINWILSQPQDLIINDLSIDPIQNG
jgi:hypothetical protein